MQRLLEHFSMMVVAVEFVAESMGVFVNGNAESLAKRKRATKPEPVTCTGFYAIALTVQLDGEYDLERQISG